MESVGVRGRIEMPEAVAAWPARTVVPALVLGAALATVAVGLTAKAFGVHWGAPAQPLILFLRPALSTWALPGIAVLAAAALVAPRLLRAEVGGVAFGLSAFALSLLTRVALNVVRGGPEALYEVFVVRPTGEGRSEYLPGLTFLEGGVDSFLRRFPDLVAELPTHVAGHPPGLLLSLHWLGIDTAQGAAALTIGVGALAAPLLYLLARRLCEERTARVAALLFVFVPTSLLYGATSGDALFATLGVLAAALLVARPILAQALGGFALAVASFFSYALLAVGAWAAIVRWRGEGIAAALRLALLCGAALLAFYLGLHALTGFDLLAAIGATHDRYHEGVAGRRPYLFYLFGSPAAFLLMLGPVAWFAIRAAVERETTALALTAIVVISAVAGYTKAETERIWLFLVPLACLAAARSLPTRRLSLLLVALTAQALATQLLLFTKW